METLKSLCLALDGDNVGEILRAYENVIRSKAKWEEIAQACESLEKLCSNLARWSKRIAEAAVQQPENPDADVDNRISRASSTAEVNKEEEQPVFKIIPVVSLIIKTLVIESTARGRNSIVLPSEGTLFEPAWRLHSSIVDFLQRGEMNYANEISMICELFWSKTLPRADELVPQTISFLLVRILDCKELSSSAWTSDLKRLNSMRTALSRVDFNDESSESVRNLLLRAVIHPRMLRTSEGIRFISSLFLIHVSLIPGIHSAIKCQLRTLRKPQIDAYAEVYFRAWRGSTGQSHMTIEQECIQDIMSLAVHVASPTLQASLARILSYFHARKPQRGVDEMLFRLYGPILWRALSVANPLVRRNAASLLVDAFPLQDPGAPQREIDSNLQKQFDFLTSLLRDDHEGVRRVSVTGVARVLSLYWELIPAATCSALLSSLETLAHDKASPTVRSAAVDGFHKILDNHATHVSIRPILSQLTPLIHDTSEKVRISMIRLLEFVRGLRSFRFFDIVPLDHILYRLSCERRPLAKKITKLLAPTYFPYEKPSRIVLARAARLVESNKEAAIAFFRNLPNADVPLAPMCKLIARILRLEASRSLPQERQAPPNPDSLPQAVIVVPLIRFGSEVIIPKSPKKPSKISGEGSDEWAKALSLDVLRGLLECSSVLWEAISPLLDKNNSNSAEQQVMKESLLKVTNWDAMKRIAEFLGSKHSKAAAMSIASRLPNGPNEQQLTEEFSGINPDVTIEECEPLLRCVFSKEMAETVLEQIAKWINLEDSDKEHCLLGLRLLNTTLSNSEMRHSALGNANGIHLITEQLLHHVEVAQKEITEEKECTDEAEMNIAILSLTIYCKLLVHTMAVSNEKDPPVMQQLIDWTRVQVVPKVSTGGLAILFAEVVAIISAELSVVGLNGIGVINSTASLFEEIIQTAAGDEFVGRIIPHLGKFVFHLLHQSGSNNEGNNISTINTAKRVLLCAIGKLSMESLSKLQMQDTLALLSARTMIHGFVFDFVQLALKNVKGTELFEADLKKTPDSTMFLSKLCIHSSMFLNEVISVINELHSKSPVNAQTTWKLLNTCSFILDLIESRKGNRRGNNFDSIPIQDFFQTIVSEFADGSLAQLGSMELSDLNDFANQQLRRCYKIQNKPVVSPASVSAVGEEEKEPKQNEKEQTKSIVEEKEDEDQEQAVS